jgi:arylsulfatase A-like enzyme
VDDWYPDGIFQAKKTWDTFVRDYARTVRAVDDALSTVLERLDEIGQANDTLVIHTADHGFFHGEFGLGNKRWLYDPSIRIPYLVRYPGVTANTGWIEEGLSTNLDIPATIYEAAGLDIPTICQGQSLLPVLRDEVRETREAILVEYFYDAPFTAYPSMLCVRTRTEKLIRYLNDGDIDEYYDLEADPHERHNRAEDPAHRSDVERMTGLLDREMEAVGFEFPDLSQDYSGYRKL